jgi:glycosyltransferase involved in cell wall biosynthesis
MKENKILIIGYFGYETNQLDGQTVKTRNVYELLKKHEKEFGSVLYYDTQKFRYNKTSIIDLFRSVSKCNYLILIPARNNLTYLFPILFVLSKIFKYNIIHIGVGGWQKEYFEKHNIQRWMAKNIAANLLQNKLTVSDLKKKFGFNNAEVIPNYRIHNHLPNLSSNSDEDFLRIVFMSRINKKKGLNIIFKIAEYYTNINPQKITIDLYGPIETIDEDYFFEQIEKHSLTKYHGILQTENIYTTLENYDILILPTQYYTEGFPGAILDAYIAGIPVLVSNWKHANEFVENGVSGFICEMNDVNQYAKK